MHISICLRTSCVIARPIRPTKRCTALRYTHNRRCSVRVRASKSEIAPDKPSRSTAFLTSPYDGEIIRVVLPALCAGLLGPLCTAVDTGMSSIRDRLGIRMTTDLGVAGQLGALQLSGLGIGSVVYMFLSNLFLFSQFLITPAVARTNAEKKYDKVRRSILRRSIYAPRFSLL